MTVSALHLGLYGSSLCSSDVTGSCYIGLYELGLSWLEALTLCTRVAYGGHLVYISSQDEFDIVQTFIARKCHFHQGYAIVSNDISSGP